MASLLERAKKLHHSMKPIPLTAADHDYRNGFLRSRGDIEQLLPLPLGESSILIIGCGFRYADVLLYSGCAKSANGLDVRDVFYRDGFRPLYHDFRRKGKGVLSSLRKSYKTRNGLSAYYERIGELAGGAIDHEGVDLGSYEGGKMPFEDGQFDAVLSNAVLEHVADLETFFSEVRRVTKPRGISYHLYHNYYSFSGSHLPPFMCEKHPWGHLRGLYQTDPKHLNQVTLDAVVERFSTHFELRDVFPVGRDHSKKGVDETFCFEREDRLTPEIRDELKEYSDEQLLTRGYLIIGSRRGREADASG
jgi:SAM-dependent methyltransferase